MSGHSHWGTIKRKKQAEDAKRSRLFSKLTRAITIAVREGQGNIDPATNPRLRLAIEQARLANLPKEKIQRAIERGQKIGERDGFRTITLGGFFSHNIALLMEGITDNRRRTLAEVRALLERRGGSLASLESVKPYFQQVSVLSIPRSGRGEDAAFELALEVGAQDLRLRPDGLDLIVELNDVGRVKEQLRQKNITVEKEGLEVVVKIETNLASKQEQQKLEELVRELEEHEDITKVYTNATAATPAQTN